MEEKNKVGKILWVSYIYVISAWNIYFIVNFAKHEVWAQTVTNIKAFSVDL